MRHQPEKTSQTPPTSPATRKRVLLGLGATLLLALVAGWSVPEEPSKEAKAAAHVGPAASTAWAAARPASGPASSAPVASATPQPPFSPQKQAVEFDVEALRQLERQWCSHGSQAYAQYYSSALAQQLGEFNIHLLEQQMKQWPSHRAQEQLRTEILDGWIAALRQRGDLRSRATALYLQGDEKGAAGTQELTALARSHNDAYVAALASQRVHACRQQADCKRLTPEERLAKDPNNLVALLQAYEGTPELLPRLAQLLTQSPAYHHYNKELLQMLLKLPATAQDGLRREVELNLLIGMRASWNIPAVGPAIRACKAPVAAPMQGNTCQLLSQALWHQAESLLDQGLSLAVAKAMGADEQAPWVARREQFNSLKNLQLNQHNQLNELVDSRHSTGNACHWQERFKAHLDSLALHGELGAMREWKRNPALPSP